jgi:hypothetical protein
MPFGGIRPVAGRRAKNARWAAAEFEHWSTHFECHKAMLSCDLPDAFDLDGWCGDEEIAGPLGLFSETPMPC